MKLGKSLPQMGSSRNEEKQISSEKKRSVGDPEDVQSAKHDESQNRKFSLKLSISYSPLDADKLLQWLPPDFERLRKSFYSPLG